MREEILRELTEEVKVIVGEERKVICREISKNNGVKLQGITIAAKNEFMAPTIYVDGYVEKISDGEMSIEEAAETIVEIYHQNQGMDLGVDTSVLGSKEFILGKVEYQLVNTEGNKKRLENVPHKELLDLSAVYRVVVSRDENGSASYMVTNEMIETAGITMPEQRWKTQEKMIFTYIQWWKLCVLWGCRKKWQKWQAMVQECMY